MNFRHPETPMRCNGSAVTLAASGLRLSARHAGTAPHSAVAELGVGDSSRLPKFARA